MKVQIEGELKENHETDKDGEIWRAILSEFSKVRTFGGNLNRRYTLAGGSSTWNLDNLILRILIADESPFFLVVRFPVGLLVGRSPATTSNTVASLSRMSPFPATISSKYFGVGYTHKH